MKHLDIFTRVLPIALLFSVAAAAPMQAQVFGPNLIVDSDAEAGPASVDDTPVANVPGWTNKGANVIVYASGYGLSTGSILPTNIGKNYFSSGKVNSTLTQTVNLSAGAAGIDAGTAVYTASGYFGGFSDRDDFASLTIAYLGANNNTLSTATIGGVKSADRYATGLYLRRKIGLVPVGARSATVTLSFTLATPGSNNNAYADNLSLVLNTPAAANTFLGRNVIVNGDAEAGIPIPPGNDVAFDIPGWVRTANFTTDTYVDSGEVTVNDPGPADRGKFLFLGGPDNAAANAYQDIDVSPLAAQVDANNVKFAFGAWVGGYSDQEDFMVVTAKFLDWAGNLLGSSQLGPVNAADRRGVTAILQRSSNGAIPAGTRQIQVRMDATRRDGLYDDGFADSLTLVLSAGGAAPNISTGGIATAAAFGGSKQIAPGTWIEIYGQNLASAAREWAGADFAGTTAPTALDGVRVTVGGLPAYVRFVSPGQVNVQVPSGVGAGAQNIVLSNAGGSSAPYPITVNASQAGFLAPASFAVNGKQYVAGLFADGGTFTVPAALIPGVSSRAASPGETVVLYGVGFGPTTPNIVAGQITGASNTLANPLQITIGGAAARTTYNGLTGGFVGLYQFNVVIPAVAAGDAVPLVVTLGGVAVPQTLFIAVGK